MAKAKAAAVVPFDPPNWPASRVEMRRLENIKPYPNNPRTHPIDQIKMLAADMKADGVIAPILVDEKGEIIAGHGRLLAAQMNQFVEYPVIVAHGWTDVQKRAVRIKDNQRALQSGWNEELLAFEMSALKTEGYDLPSMGFSGDEMEAFELAFEGIGIERGELLKLIDVVIAEPKNKTEIGEHYILSGRHHLLVVSVVTGWPRWGSLLTGKALFCPYPGVFVPFSKRAEKHPLVMVQPDPYIAGHILDRYEEIKGKKEIKFVGGHDGTKGNDT
jgi:ParB-like nuclease domain